MHSAALSQQPFLGLFNTFIGYYKITYKSTLFLFKLFANRFYFYLTVFFNENGKVIILCTTINYADSIF